MRQGSNQHNPNIGILGGELRYLALLIFAALAYLIVGLWLRQVRWINPDEGAHIADAVLLLDGKIPVVDFSSRQPLYILFIAIDLFFMGSTLAAARVAPLIATIATSVILYFFIRLHLEPSYALAGSLAYLLIPLNFAFSTVVKMEPFALAIATTAGFSCIAALSSDRPSTRLFAAGLLIGASFYVRESTAYAVLFGSVVTLVFFRPAKYASRALAIMYIVAGSICAVLLVFGVFAPYMGVAAYLKSPLNPLDIVFRSTQDLSSPSFRLQPVKETFDSIRFLLYTHTFLIFGSLIGIGSWFSSSHRSRYRADVAVFCGSWLAGLVMIYAIRGIKGAIHPSYGREFTVPAIVLTLVGIRWLWHNLQRYMVAPHSDRALLMSAIALQVLLVVGQLFMFQEPQFVFFISLLLLIAVLRVRMLPNGNIEKYPSTHDQFWLYASAILFSGVLIRGLMTLSKPMLGGDAYFYLGLGALAVMTCVALRRRYIPWSATGLATTLILVVASTMYSLSGSAEMLDRKFHCVWSPAQLLKVAVHLGERVPKGGSVLSGANIWAIEAERKVFGNVTHPLGLSVPPGYVRGRYRRIGGLLKESPPEAIVLDGYTERTYGSQWDLAELIKRRYSVGENVTIEGESRYPVVIYLRSDVARLDISSPGDVDTL